MASSNQERAKRLGEYLYTVKRKIEDHNKHEMSQNKFAILCGTKQANMSKWINGEAVPKTENIDTMVTLLEEWGDKNDVQFDAWQIYDLLEMPPRLSTKETEILDIVRWLRRISPEKRAEIHAEIKKMLNNSKVMA